MGVGSIPVIAVTGAAVLASTGAALLYSKAYENNFLGVKDVTKFIGKGLDFGLSIDKMIFEGYVRSISHVFSGGQ